MRLPNLEKSDPAIFSAVNDELKRQRDVLELIASENIVSKAVLEAAGSVLTNKYSEGYPSKRYYGGNEHIDICENLARDRAKQLFGAEHANVQPHSGSSANAEAYFALMKMKDTVLAQSLDHGGHLTHGHAVNFSGSFYNFVHYGVDKETEQFDMDAVRKQAHEVKPKLLLAGASAYPRTIDFKAFREIADEVGAYFMVDMAHIAGLVAAKIHPDPIPYADVVTTTTHKTLRGPRGAMILSKEEDRLIDTTGMDDKKAMRMKNLARRIDAAVFPGMQGGPLDHVIAAKAVAFQEALQPDFISYQKQVLKNAQALGDALQDYGYRLVSGGTDNHLLLIDLTKQNVTGKLAELALDEAGITVNKNMIPYDPRTPFNPSGIRIGTPALTTRGMKESEMKEVAKLMHTTLSSPEDSSNLASVKQQVYELCSTFPLYE